jgi:chromate transporter
MATYAGFNAAGLPGGIVATLSLVLPSLIVIILIAKLLENFSKNPYVKSAFYTIRPAVTGLIATAVLGIWETSLFTTEEGTFQFPIFSVILVAVFFAAMNHKKLKKLHPALQYGKV